MNESHIFEGDVTNAPIPLISFIRCGQQSTQSFSKSKLANALFKFKCDVDFGSFGFFTKGFLSSNDSRQTAEGTVEGLWFESKSNRDILQASFGLLNLRGDAPQHIESATTPSSISHVLFMFYDRDMFKDDCYKKLLQNTAEKLKLKNEREKKISKLVVVFTKDAQRTIKKIEYCSKILSKPFCGRG